MVPGKLDPCDLCPLFPQGHDASPVPPSCLECPYFYGNKFTQAADQPKP